MSYADEIRKEQERRAHMAQQDRQREKTAPTTEQIREYLEAESKTVEQRVQEERNAEIGTAWIAANPQYQPSPHAASTMQEWLDARELPITHENLDAAFNHLKSKGLISHNENVVNRQVQQRAQESELMRRARAIEEQNAASRKHSMQEMYEMPMEDLARLAWER
jgi:hypothetical protein